MTISMNSLTAPYLAIAQHFNVDYGDVLLSCDQGEAGSAAALRINRHPRGSEIAGAVWQARMLMAELRQDGIDAVLKRRAGELPCFYCLGNVTHSQTCSRPRREKTAEEHTREDIDGMTEWG